jgi:uncharacterized protein YfaS (alpha-2-macroglobulin family)
MKKTWLFNLAALCLLVMTASGQNIAKLRSERDGMIDKGLWKEALDLYEEKLLPVGDESSGNDLKKAVQCLQELGDWARLDEVVESAVETHPDEPGVLAAAGDTYQTTMHSGRWLAGDFERGAGGYFRPFPRGRRGLQQEGDANAGEIVDCSYRDYIRALQLLKRVVDASRDETSRAEAWNRLASAVTDSREAWKLQVLTPLDQLPAWDESGPSGGTEGAPWKDGGPVLYEAPASWEVAKNDGERWRFALAELARLKPDSQAEVDVKLATFSRSQFGVGTLASYGWWHDRDEESEKGILQVNTLADDECLARTSEGVRRFKLPAEHHFISLFRSAYAKGSDFGGDQLVQIYLDRGQRDRAEEVLRDVIAKHGEGHQSSRATLLRQVTGSWGRMEAAKTVAAGTRPKVPLVFRNADSIRFTAAPVDMEAVLRDMKDYLGNNPTELDYQRIQPSQIAQRLLEGKADAFLGKVVATWEVKLAPLDNHRDTQADIEVPLDQPGAWWITGTLANGNKVRTLVWIIDTIVVQHSTAGGHQIWLADAATGAVIPDAEVELFGYVVDHLDRKDPKDRRVNIITKTLARTTDGEGKVLIKPEEWGQRYRWTVIGRKSGRSTTFAHFNGNRGYGNDTPERNLSYGVTDRPLYKAGDTVHAKFWLRNVGYGETDEARWVGKQGRATFRDGRGQEILKFENLKTDALGAVEIEAVLPKDAVLGQWSVIFEIPNQIGANVNFRVEEYRKPEYEVSVEAPAEPVRLGDKFKAVVKASYFHGAPVRNAMVEITVNRESINERWFPMWRWDWLYGKGAWWCGVEAPWHPGWEKWGCFLPSPPWGRTNRWTPPELVIKQTLPIGPDGTVEIEVDTGTAKAVHGDIDARYVITAKVVDASRREETGNGEVVAARKPFEVVVSTNRGFARPGEDVEATVSAATLVGKPVVGAEGSLSLFHLSVGENGAIEEKEVSIWPVKTDAEGQLKQRFQAPAAGQYRLAAKLSLNGGQVVESGLIFNVHGSDKPDAGWHFGALELVADKSSYAPGETVRLRINSDHANAQVWLFIRAEQGGGKEARRIVLDGRSAEVEIPLTRDDMPNTFIEGVTVHGAEVHTAVRQILLPPESRMLEVSVEPAKSRVKPQEESALAIIVKDGEGKPFHGTTTVTIYDKALEAITGGSNVGPIRENFWSWKRHYGGVMTVDSIPRVPGWLRPPDEEQMQLLGRFGNSAVLRRAGFAGESRMMAKANGMADAFAAPVAEAAMQLGASAGGEAPSVAVRKDFADLLKWSGEVKTDAEGRAEIPLKFPDNLTTWKARVWALGDGTRVGEGSAEIITSKELLVRLEMPRFLVEKDEAVFSAVVHNDHDSAKTVRISLELEGNAVEKVEGSEQTVEIAAKGETRVDWKVKALKEGEATVRMKALADDDGDAIEKTLPVVVHGMLRQEAWSRVADPGTDSTKIEFAVPSQRRVDQTKLTVRFSPTVAGAVVDAIPFLADYPHGCTEQTLNRFVPAVIARKMLEDLGLNLEAIREKRNNLNAQELGNPKDRAEQWKRWNRNPVFDSLELARMEKAGIDRLMTMQNGDGGWGWFSGYRETSYAHTTVVVVHGLLQAKANGSQVPEAMLNRGVAWLEAHENKEVAALNRHAERAADEKAGKKLKPTKEYLKGRADATDAFVRLVLGEAEKDGSDMLDYLFRDRLELPVYARCLTALELHRKKSEARRDEIMATIAQFLKRDHENQTNYLDLKNGNFWWFWYGSDVEANSWYLKLLSAVKPKAPETRGLAKYLVNNRRHASYWNSTRDTAYAIEALAAYLKATEELAPSMEVEVLLDGKSLQKVTIDKDNLFSFDGTIIVSGADLADGDHVVELRRSGEGSLYANAYLEVFSLEDFLRKAGLEVKVERHVYKLVPDESETDVPDSSGLVVNQRVEKFRREALKDGDVLASGDRIEVELVLESKNDYEYLIFSDAKAAGFEASESLSGYVGGALPAYMEPKDQTVDFYIRRLPRGTHQLRYQLRAEAPGFYHALPAKAEAMYAPELRANSDEIRLKVTEAK